MGQSDRTEAGEAVRAKPICTVTWGHVTRLKQGFRYGVSASAPVTCAHMGWGSGAKMVVECRNRGLNASGRMDPRETARVAATLRGAAFVPSHAWDHARPCETIWDHVRGLKRPYHAASHPPHCHARSRMAPREEQLQEGNAKACHVGPTRARAQA